MGLLQHYPDVETLIYEYRLMAARRFEPLAVEELETVEDCTA